MQEDIDDPMARGRSMALTPEEERVIVAAILLLAEHNTPLRRSGIVDLVEHFVREMMPAERLLKLPFINCRPSFPWIRRFVKRHRELELKASRPVEMLRTRAVRPDVLAAHFVRTEAIYAKYNIRDSRQVFNIDETGVSFRDLSRGRCIRAAGSSQSEVVSAGARFRGNIDHVTLMPVVSADGSAYTPLVVIPGKRAPWKKVDGSILTVNDVIMPGTLLCMREGRASVDKHIFFKWAEIFIRETEALRKELGTIVLHMDCFRGHVQYKALHMLQQANIVVQGLPAHASHELQPLDVSVFAAFKSKIRSGFDHALIGYGTKRFDVFAAAELLKNAYDCTVNRTNIISGFEKTGLWSNQKRGVDPSVVSNITITAPTCHHSFPSSVPKPINSITSHDSGGQSIRQADFRSLVASFRRHKRTLLSAGTIEENGTVRVVSTTGVVLTNESVMNALRAEELRKTREISAKENAAARREVSKKRRMEVAVARKNAKRIRDHIKDDKEEAALQKLTIYRSKIRSTLAETRVRRREHARARTMAAMAAQTS